MPESGWIASKRLDCTKVVDQLLYGRRFRALAIVDNFSHKCLAIHVDSSIKGNDVRVVVSRMRTRYGQSPECIQLDNGSEFISKAFDELGYDHGVTLDFSRSGKPTDNP